MSLHPQARALIGEMKASGRPPIYELSPALARAQSAAVVDWIGRGVDIAQVEDLAVPRRGGEIHVRRYAPEHPSATIQWMHSGGWVIYDLESHDALCRKLAWTSGCEVIAVDYRRAPEHPFPAALEDSWDVLNWLAAREPGQAPLLIGGDSAGGNLAAVCALRARDRFAPELALQILAYPVTDHDMTTASYLERGHGDAAFLTTQHMRWFWDQYVADPSDREDPEASPLRAMDLSRLPRAVILTAEYDPLRDEGIAYVERLRAAGVQVSHHHYADMSHGFLPFVDVLARSNEAIRCIGVEIREAIATLSTDPRPRR